MVTDSIARTVVLDTEEAPANDSEPLYREAAGRRFRITVPLDSDFEAEELEFLKAPDLEALGNDLRAEKPHFADIDGLRIGYLWKRKGGSFQGKSVLGKCSKTPPMVKTFRPSTFTIWLAADHCRDFNLTDDQFEALLFHELLHVSMREVEVKDPVTKEAETEYRPAIAALDFEMFLAEIAEYGLWRAELKRAQDAFAQAALPGFAAMTSGGAL